MGFGAMRITGKGIWGPPADVPGALATLRRAVELGVNFIDTADSYGPMSQRTHRRGSVAVPAGLVIATKAAGCATVRASGSTTPRLRTLSRPSKAA